MLYNSTAVVSAVQQEFGESKHRPIISAIDDYANNSMATENLLMVGDEVDRNTFRRGAIKHVRKELYGGFGGLLIWMIAKPFIMAIIERFIDSMVSGSMASESEK